MFVQHVVPNLSAGHAGYATAAVPAASVGLEGGYQRLPLHATNITAQPPVVVAAASAAAVGDLQQQSASQSKDLLLTSSSPTLNDTLLPVRTSVCLCISSFIHSFIYLFASDQWSVSRKTTTAEERKRQKHAYTQTPKKGQKSLKTQ